MIFLPNNSGVLIFNNEDKIIAIYDPLISISPLSAILKDPSGFLHLIKKLYIPYLSIKSYASLVPSIKFFK